MKPLWVPSLALCLITSVTLGKSLHLLSFSFLICTLRPIILKWRKTLWGPPRYKSFHVSHFLFVGNRLHSASLTFPESHREDSNRCLSEKGGDAETKEESVHLLSHVWLFVTSEPTQLMSIVLVMPLATQPSHPLSFSSPLAFNLSQNQGLFIWVDSLHQMAKVLEFQLQHQSFQWIFWTDFL